MCAHPRSSIWRRREPGYKLADGAGGGGQDMPDDVDDDCEDGLPNLIDSPQMESDDHGYQLENAVGGATSRRQP